ncbi:sensor histidine kinase [Larkinella sp. VNQ87]|uniref:sensor histidine kinase n=1 Tax=Larkinella sp. VNQ87 TaxID=3400921 RepID=UPI003C044872
MQHLTNRWIRLIGISLLAVLSISSSGYLRPPITQERYLKIGIAVFFVILIWESNRLLIGFFLKRYPQRSQTLRRILWTLPAGFLVTTVLIVIVNIGSSLLLTGRPSFPTRSADSILSSAFSITLAILGVYEAFRISFLLRQSEKEKEQLKIANLQSQLEALKQQVNPHFLFNSLNSLGALIEENPAQASRFLEELSSVYRYLLRSNEQDLIALTTELDFIRSYFHLLKTRHGEGLELRLRVDEQYENDQLPPLTLQLLVENAVKHNMVLPDQPLTIEITTTEDGHVQVVNNLQRKRSRVLSNGVGINNILSKYRMLNQPVPSIRETGGKFWVTLPLIKQKA